MPQFHALIIHLQAQRPAHLPATQGQLAHAAFLAMVRSVNPPLAQALHDFPDRKPFTLSPVWGLPPARQGQHTIRAGQTLRLRLTILDTTLFDAFMQKIFQTPYQTIRLGDASFLITQILGAPGSDPWAGYATPGTLAQQATRERRITLAFASPMAIGVGKSDTGKPRRIILPIPRYVWASLRSSWNKLTGQPIPPTFETWVKNNVVVARVTSWRTSMFRFGEKKLQIGGSGVVTFEALDQNPTMLLLWNLLADFAFYAGVGVKTGMGMGVVRRLS